MAENVRALPGAEGDWTKERVELIKRTVCPKGITDDELALFIEQCKRSGLDPLLKQAFCVPRRQNIGTRDNPQWVEKREFQPAEAGMLARAEKVPDYRGCTASAVHEKDECTIDAGEGTVRHSYSPGKGRGLVIGAWARVVRDTKTPVVVWLELPGYAQNTPLWGKIPGNMIEKCARVAALRKAYPETFGGLYIEEEADLTEATSGALETPKPLAASKTDEVKGKLTAQLQAANQVSARVSRMQIVDVPSVPPEQAAPPPPVEPAASRLVEHAPQTPPYEYVAAIAMGRAMKPGALLKAAGINKRARAEVTADDLAKVRIYVASIDSLGSTGGDIEE